MTAEFYLYYEKCFYDCEFIGCRFIIKTKSIKNKKEFTFGNNGQVLYSFELINKFNTYEEAKKAGFKLNRKYKEICEKEADRFNSMMNGSNLPKKAYVNGLNENQSIMIDYFKKEYKKQSALSTRYFIIEK